MIILNMISAIILLILAGKQIDSALKEKTFIGFVMPTFCIFSAVYFMISNLCVCN